MDTITMTLPSAIELTGARGITATMDVEKVGPDGIVNLVRYAAGVISQRASAQGCETLAEKQGAERIALDRVASGNWKPGGGGGGRSLSLEEQAQRNVLVGLFESQGLAKTAAEKRARGEYPFHAYLLTAVCAKRNTTDVPKAEIDALYETNREAFAQAIAAEVERLKEEEARKRELSAGIRI